MSDHPPSQNSRRIVPIPVETTVKKVRKFAAEPVETTNRNNKKEAAQQSVAGEEKPAKRRFIPEPVETSFKSSKQVGSGLPTPETTPTFNTRTSPSPDPPKARRKFTPDLIETTKRTKKAGDVRPATLPTDKASSFITLTFIARANCIYYGRLI